MADRIVRIGRVSSIDATNGMVSVTYPDLDDSVTAMFPYFSFTGEYKMPSIGQDVVVVHLSNGQSAGVVLGGYFNKSNKPPASSGFRKELGSKDGEAFIEYSGGVLTLHAGTVKVSGSLSVSGNLTATGNISAGGTVSGSNI